jgi:hypothetical protein
MSHVTPNTYPNTSVRFCSKPPREWLLRPASTSGSVSAVILKHETPNTGASLSFMSYDRSHDSLKPQTSNLSISKALQMTLSMRSIPSALSSDGHVVLLMRALHLQVLLLPHLPLPPLPHPSPPPSPHQALVTIPLLSPAAPHIPHINLAFEFSRRNLHVVISNPIRLFLPSASTMSRSHLALLYRLLLHNTRVVRCK